ncbi:MAG: hypothetical protein AB8B70_08780, partial [Prochlorococcus sp.]
MRLNRQAHEGRQPNPRDSRSRRPLIRKAAITSKPKNCSEKQGFNQKTIFQQVQRNKPQSIKNRLNAFDL